VGVRWPLRRSRLHRVVNRVERVVNATQLAPSQFVAQGIDRPRHDMQWDLRTLRNEDQEVNDLPGWQVEESWRFVLNALPGFW
jgi:hypothetical protein